MFPQVYFPQVYFAPVYFPTGLGAVVPVDTTIDFPLFTDGLAGASVAAGTAGQFPFTIVKEDGQTAATCFVDANTIASRLWNGDAYATVSTPSVVWVDATVGTARLIVVNSDTSSLTPGDYRFQVTVTVSGQTYVVHDSTFRVTTSPGADTVPTTYCTFDLMQSIYSGLASLQSEQHDETGFLGVRRSVKNQIDYELWSRYSPRPAFNRRRLDTPDPIVGFDVPDTTTVPPTKAELRTLLANDHLIIDGPDESEFRLIAAKLAVSQVLFRQEIIAPNRGYAASAINFRDEAMKCLHCYQAWIDTDDDDIADILIDQDVTFLT